jgi:spermidine synthase
MNLSKGIYLYPFSFLLAFCSLSYELVFAHVLSVCLGGTKNQYLLTISIFTFALGLGSLVFGMIKKKFNLKNIFLFTEVFLTAIGATGPFLITWILRVGENSFFNEIVLKILSYFIIFLVGFLSGFELPCLFSYSDKNQGKTLAFDYMGMLAASLFFPLVGLPELGTAATALTIANLNFAGIIIIQPFERNVLNILFILISIVFGGLILFFREELNLLLTSLYLIGV